MNVSYVKQSLNMPCTLASIVAVACLVGAVSTAKADLDDGLVAYYPFNGNANDASGNGNNGTVIGAALVSDRHGNPNAAYSFNGVDQYIRIASSPTLCPTEQVSFSTWLRHEPKGTGSGSYVLKKGNWLVNGTYVLSVPDGPGAEVWVTTSGNQVHIEPSSEAPVGGRWSHVAGVYDGTSLAIYVDGALVGAQAVTGQLQNNDDPVIIGTDYYNPGVFFRGAIDDLRIFNRALTQCEIQALYAGTTTCSPPRLPCASLVFVSTEHDPNGEITTANPDGSSLRRITYDTPVISDEPQWSWDGQKITWYGGVPNQADIYTSNADGSAITTITPDTYNNVVPSFSPDGTQIAYASAGCGDTLKRIPSVGGAPEVLANNSSWPDWSPDGTKILNIDWGCGTVADIYLLDLGTGINSLVLATPGYAATRARWSPDGSKIAFQSNQSGTYDVWVMNADGSNMQNLTALWTTSHEQSPTWSPDGQFIAFYSNTEGNDDLYIMHADGSSLSDGSLVYQVTDTPWNERHPAWPKSALNLDSTPPVISCPANITVGCSVDARSTVNYDEPVADDACDPNVSVVCAPPSGSGFAVGTTTVTCVASDTSGNSSSCAFTITREPLGFDGFLPPIGGEVATGSGGSFDNPVRAFKLGSTIPVKMMLNCNGGSVSDGIHTLQAIKYSTATDSDPAIDATPSDAATTGNQFRLVDATTGEWHFNLGTKNSGLSIGTWLLRATLSDGSTHEVWISIKK